MPGYLLLRDNKESGPHTVEEMIAKQLKQHDLIWVEGRSAAWRYPEELEEFKKYVTVTPVVAAEKAKPAAISEMYQHPAAKKPAVPDQNTYVPSSNTSKNDIPASRERVAKYISVIFPNTVKQVPDKRQTETPPVATEKSTSAKKEKIIGDDEAAPMFSSGSFSSKFPERSLQAPVKEDKSFILAKNLIWGVAILLGGVVLGLSLDNIFTTKPGVISSAEPAAKKNIVPVTTEEKPDLNTNTDVNNTGFVTKATEPEEAIAKPIKKKPVQKISDATLTDDASAQKTNSVVDIPAINPTAVKNDAVNAEKESTKTNIRSLLSITNSKFKIGAFGGITDLQISLTNNSHYPVDVIAVDVQYILANKKVFKTETLYFRDLRPGVTVMQEAPKSSRGVKVEYVISSVNSKALGL